MKIGRTTLTIVVFASLLNLAADVPAQNDRVSNKDLTGVWTAHIQGRNCANGAAVGGGGIGLVTFAKGGTLTESSTIPAGPAPLPTPFFRGPGHGVWDKQNSQDYAASYILQRLNADGTFAGWTRLKGAIQLSKDGDEFSWTGTGELVAPNGTVLMTTCNTMSGIRFH